MLRSLFSGVTGLANHQMKLDVIGNNIANVNTVGFKSSDLTFREMLTQTIKGASRPSGGGPGGTNPQQIGLGSSVGSIKSDFSQGNMQITGIMTDMAIEGEGFFTLSDGETQYYTRDGSFSIDGAGNLVNPSNGFKVQGVLANDQGEIQHGRRLEDIVIPTSLVLPARATSEVQITGNLDASSDARGTITRSNSFYAAPDSTDTLLSLRSQSGIDAGIREGDVISISATIDGNDIESEFTVSAGSTLQDLMSSIQTSLRSEDPGVTLSLLSTGEIQVQAGASDINELSVQISGNTVFNSAFSNDVVIEAGSTGLTNDQLRIPAGSDALLSEMYDSSGSPLNITDDIVISGDVGGSAIDSSTVTFDPATTTMGDLLDGIREAFNITFGSVELDSSGRVVINGDVGGNFSITSVDIAQTGGSTTSMNSVFQFTDIQEARNAESYTVSSMVYDSLGNTHDLVFSFEKLYGQNAWTWEASMDGVETIVSGGSGTVQFGDDGLLSSFSFDGSDNQLVIDPGNGAQAMNIEIDPGEIGSPEGLIQFNRAFSINSEDMDGQALGTLESMSIDRTGVINGQFSNGSNRDLAQIAMSDFNNPGGLSRVGENMYIESPNSGQPRNVFAGANARGVITPGELEMSNVDLAGEFTEMITAQRGFQANARIISVGDQMLNELVNLKK
ncbi:MAG: flagellar hook-basal body complex protein [Candidatus Latescibacteria bacterium]|nr:flagellar hook-basal body complex protein [bacterium]MBD3424472.1 flagellar hook-basal body complex protein [Candidatus Latescibacterota bacterium]